MRNRVIFSVRSLFVLAAVLSPVSHSFAALDKFEPYAFAGVLLDSNIFRLSGDEEARARFGSTNRNDTVGNLGAGFKSDLKLSRQHLLLDAEVDRVIYDTYDDLDHTKVNGKAAWVWQVGNLWSGNLGYGYLRDMRSFDQRTVLDPDPLEKDMRTRQVGFVDAGYQLHPDWELVGGLEYSDVSYQDRKILDRDATSGRFEVLYRNTLNSRVGVRVKYADNDLKEREIEGIEINNDYKETQISGVLYWEASGKSALEANLGYTKQSFDDFDGRDYNGSTGRLKYFWQMTGKTKLDFSVWRVTSTQSDEVTTYVLTKGASIAPTWSVTPIFNLTGKIQYEDVDYKGQNDIVTALGGPRRDDDIWQLGVTADWDPRRYLRLSLGYKYVDRDSSIDVNDYDYNQVDAKVRVKF